MTTIFTADNEPTQFVHNAFVRAGRNPNSNSGRNQPRHNALTNYKGIQLPLFFCLFSKIYTEIYYHHEQSAQSTGVTSCLKLSTG